MTLRCSLIALLVAAGSLPFGARGAAAAAPWLIPPVDGPIASRFQVPSSQWGPGHRGIDYLVPAGTAVRAAAAGRVAFAGSVAGSLAVTIEHDGGLETTYSRLGEIDVEVGDAVDAGRWLGRSGASHPFGGDGLHFGVKLDGDYVDPERFLGRADISDAIRLIPVEGEPDEGDGDEACAPAHRLHDAPRPPNDNVAVAIAGIGSKTAGGISADIYEAGPELLGYPQERVYEFSYKSANGPRFHETYPSTATFGDLRHAAKRLRALLQRVAAAHPGAAVDLIAHSQGGIVARVFLESLAKSWDPQLPQVDHLVTFATPHRGAPAAAAIADIDDTVTGGFVLDRASEWARSGGPLPDPHSQAAEQLAPGSDLMDWLATEDIAFGTRALALAIPHDLVVPADRALFPGETSRVVPPEGYWGHGAIVRSRLAQGLAHAFLRDAAASCLGGWDRWGPLAGQAVGLGERLLGKAYGEAEEAVGKRIGLGLLRGLGRLIRSGVSRLWD